MNKLIILDRDGVINLDSHEFIKSPAEWIPIPGSLEAIVRFNDAGYKVIVVSNQSGVGRGLFDLAQLDLIHQKMHQSLQKIGGKINAIYFCPHITEDNCDCRKPKAGLFNKIATDYNLDLKIAKIPAVGDSLRDLEAAQTAGFEPILVLTGNGKETKEKLPVPLKNIPIFSDLKAVADNLL